MKMTKMQIKTLLCSSMACSLLLVGCSTDESIDVGKVDTLIGVGTDGFSIPAGNTEPISLINLLKIGDSDCIDTIQGGYYQFFKEDEGIDETEVKIDPVSVDLDNSKIQTIKFTMDIAGQYLPHARKMDTPRRADGTKAFDQTISSFNFTEENLTGAIREVKLAEIDPVPFSLEINFSTGLQSVLKKFSNVAIDMPKYFTIENNIVTIQNGANNPSEKSLDDGKINLTNISTGSDLVIKGNIVAIDFNQDVETSTDGKNYKRQLKFEASSNSAQDLAKVIMNGYVYIYVDYNEADDCLTFDVNNPAEIAAALSGKTAEDFQIISTFTMGDGSAHPKMHLRDVKGRFYPNIDLSIDPVKITDIPDFLKEDDVELDLDDIFMDLNVESTLPIVGKVNASVTPYIDNQAKETITLKDITIEKNGTSKILISRKDNRTTKSGYTDYHWKGDPDGSGDIGTLLTNIPDKIEFSCEAYADSTEEFTIYLGRNYTITPSYKLYAPLALKGNSCVVYDDSADDWNKDLKDNDIDLDGETFLMVEGDVVNNTPLDLEIDTPTPMGVGGTDISVVTVQLTDGNGSKLNTLSIKSHETTKLRLKISTTGNGLKELDGIKYTVRAKAASNGQVEALNGRTHTVQIKNLLGTLKGKVTINPDK